MLPSNKLFFLSLTIVLLFTAFMASSGLVSAHFAATMDAHHVVAKVEGHPEVEQKQAMWRKQPWMNHGSDRGSRKHLVNPTMPHPFEVYGLPV